MTPGFKYFVAILLIGIVSNSIRAQEPSLKIEMPGAVNGLAVTPDGSTVVVGFGDTLSDSVRIWDLATGKLKSKLPVEGVYAMQLAPDGNMLAVSTGKTIELWNLKT